MTFLQITSKDDTIYYVDVVKQRLKHLQVKGKPVRSKAAGKWVKYLELQGKSTDKALKIVWDKKGKRPATRVVLADLQFVQG